MSNQPTRTVDASALLEAVATASTTPGEAFPGLRSLLGATDGAEAVYDALRSLVWSLVASREEGGHLDRWADVVLRLRQALRRGDPVRAERFTVLADLLAQSSGFPVLQPRPDVVKRKNVVAILSILEREGGRAARGAIQAATGLKDANLSRILANLASGGLISRSSSGREVEVRLTPEGVAQARRARPPATDPQAVIDGLAPEELCGIWSGLGLGVVSAVTDAGGSIAACDAGFAALAGLDDPRALVGRPLEEVVEQMEGARSGPAPGSPVEIAAADGRRLRLDRRARGGRVHLVGFDVTHYAREIDDMRKRERMLARRAVRAPATSRVAVPATPSVDDRAMWPMAASMRHDVMEPMSSIRGLAYNLRYELSSSTHRAQPGGLLDALVAQVERLAISTGDIVRFGELLEGATGALSATDTTLVVHDVAIGLGRSLRNAQATFKVAEGRQPVVKMDQPAYRAILLQALAGVLEMTERGGTLLVKTSVSSGNLVTHVSAPALDSAFAVLADSRTLTICDAVVRRLGGEFDFHSSSREGVSASFTWPVVVVRRRAGESVP